MIRTNNRFGVSTAAMAAGMLAMSLLVLLLWPPLPTQAQSATGGAPITVNTTKDETTPNDNECSLREAIQNANDNAQTSSDCKAGRGGNTITFKKGLSGTITLDPTLGPLTVTASAGLTIDGGRESITVSGGDQVQVFSESAGATLALRNLTVADGSAASGGGIENNGGMLTVTDSTFSGNSAVGTGSDPIDCANKCYGGGIENDGGTLTVTGSTFTGNESVAVGGGIANINGGTLTVTNSTFSGNSAGFVGGGISNDGTLTVTYSTFSDNGSNVGGGIGNAISSTATLSNTILANSKGNNPLNCGLGTYIDAGYNISDDQSCHFTDPTSKNSTNPLLDPNGLQDNGGPTKTIALQEGSPAIDYIPKGQNGCNTTIKTDQRGVKRPQGKACDVGAYELQKQAKQARPTQ
jgi:CSLREA domain-containing protein